MSVRMLAVVGAALGFFGVAAGAFGAHALRARIPASQLTVFETAARYQMYHALAVLAVAWAMSHWPAPAFTWAGWLFLVGTVIFSGSLYLLAISGASWLGAITPVGGLCLLAGWLSLAWGLWSATD